MAYIGDLEDITTKILASESDEDLRNECIALEKMFEIGELYNSVFMDPFNTIEECIKNELVKRFIRMKPTTSEVVEFKLVRNAPISAIKV